MLASVWLFAPDSICAAIARATAPPSSGLAAHQIVGLIAVVPS
jgi:hypothetical protein